MISSSMLYMFLLRWLSIYMATLLIKKWEIFTWEEYLPDMDVYMGLCENEMSLLQRGIQWSRGQALG